MSTEPTPHPDPPTSVLDARVSIADPRCPLVPPRAAHRRLHHRCRRARPRQGARPQEQRPAVSPGHRGVQAHLHPDAPSSRSVSSVIDTIGIPSRGCRGRRRHPAASGGDGARAVAPLRVRRRTRRRREKARRDRRGPRDGHGIAGAYPDGGERSWLRSKAQAAVDAAKAKATTTTTISPSRATLPTATTISPDGARRSHRRGDASFRIRSPSRRGRLICPPREGFRLCPREGFRLCPRRRRRPRDRRGYPRRGSSRRGSNRRRTDPETPT